MKSYILALAVGWFVGLIYGCSGIRSPAPPVIALVGLLGMLAGESTVPMAKRFFSGHRSADPMAVIKIAPKAASRPTDSEDKR
jgi:XapX domain-containing protein